mgnify:CR=1 FL=1
MKNILYQKMIFIIVLIIYLIFFVLTIPTYVSLKVMSFSDEPFYNLCSYIFSAINKSEIIYNFFWHWVNKISEWTLVTSFVVNIANMVFGFGSVSGHQGGQFRDMHTLHQALKMTFQQIHLFCSGI